MTAREGEPGRKKREGGRKVAGQMNCCPPPHSGTPVSDLDSPWGGPGWPF